MIKTITEPIIVMIIITTKKIGNNSKSGHAKIKKKKSRSSIMKSVNANAVMLTVVQSWQWGSQIVAEKNIFNI